MSRVVLKITESISSINTRVIKYVCVFVRVEKRIFRTVVRILSCSF